MTKFGNESKHDATDNSYQKLNQYYNHANHIGSVNVITDSQGREFKYVEYAPYGEQWISETATLAGSGAVGPDAIEFGFTDHLHDEETGLIYANARYLDPKTSRWMSADPAMGEYLATGDDLPAGGVYNSRNLQTYHYAGNNPIMYWDPTGHNSEKLDQSIVTRWRSSIHGYGLEDAWNIYASNPIQVKGGNNGGIYASECVYYSYAIAMRIRGYEFLEQYKEHPINGFQALQPLRDKEYKDDFVAGVLPFIESAFGVQIESKRYDSAVGKPIQTLSGFMGTNYGSIRFIQNDWWDGSSRTDKHALAVIPGMHGNQFVYVVIDPWNGRMFKIEDDPDNPGNVLVYAVTGYDSETGGVQFSSTPIKSVPIAVMETIQVVE